MIDLAVIMSVYKNDKLCFLKESVQSILDQTFSDFHYFIVFDGPVSFDVESYFTSLEDKRIKQFRLEANSGQATALNFLLKIVLNEPDYRLIGRMDADDVSLPDRFEKQRNFLLTNPDIACVGCWYNEIDESGNLISLRKLPIKHEELKKRYYTRIPFAHPSVMYNRQLIEKAGYYPANTILMEDNVLWGNALLAGLKFANLPEYLLKFRIDKQFFIRRSGLRYGWSFILTRLRIIKSLDPPFFSYLFTVFTGIVKMFPPFFLRYLYKLSRKY